MSLSSGVSNWQMQPGHIWNKCEYNKMECWQLSLGDIWLCVDSFKYNNTKERCKGHVGHHGCLDTCQIVDVLLFLREHVLCRARCHSCCDAEIRKKLQHAKAAAMDDGILVPSGKKGKYKNGKGG